MPKRRTHGEGDVSEWTASTGKHNRYRARIRITLPDGTRKRVAGYGPTPTTARADRDAKVERLMQQHPDSGNLTVRQFSMKWLSHKKLSVKASTLNDYAKTTLRHILPHIGDIPLQDVTPLDLQRLQANVIASGQAGPYKTKNLNAADKARKVLKMMYKQANRWEVTDRDPTTAIDPLQKDPPKRGVWDPGETRAFLAALRTGQGKTQPNKHARARQSWYYPIFYAALTTGMRRGELCGLKWSDIRRNYIHVERTYSQVGNEWLIGPPKTRESKRRLPVSAGLKRVLEEHRDKLERHAARTTFEWQPNDWVFPSKTGNLIYPPNLRLRLHDYADKAGVPRLRFHDLRRIFASNFIQAGGSPKLLQRWLGHATADLAMEVYTDVIEADLDASALELDDVLNPIHNPIHNPKHEDDEEQPMSEVEKMLDTEDVDE